MQRVIDPAEVDLRCYISTHSNIFCPAALALSHMKEDMLEALSWALYAVSGGTSPSRKPILGGASKSF
jgi:hypothetical protein